MSRDLIAIGASAGGVEALREIIGGLPADLGAAVLVTLHVGAAQRSVLPELLEAAGPLPAEHATDGQQLRRGHVLVAPPDRHLVVVDGVASLSRGARENGSRPAVDPMFRSAARVYGHRVVGVILSGSMDDGTSGMAAIKARGGATIAQSPASAAYPDMPLHAIEAGVVDQVLPVEDIAAALVRLAGKRDPDHGESLPTGARRRTRRDPDADETAQPLVAGGGPGTDVPDAYSCPDCGGVLRRIEVQGAGQNFRCMVGHAWSGQTLLGAQLEQVEESLWAALRALEEHRKLVTRMLLDARSRGSLLSERYEDRLRDIDLNAVRIRAVLLNPVTDDEPADTGHE